jgi:hypothetical protein
MFSRSFEPLGSVTSIVSTLGGLWLVLGGAAVLLSVAFGTAVPGVAACFDSVGFEAFAGAELGGAFTELGAGVVLDGGCDGPSATFAGSVVDRVAVEVLGVFGVGADVADEAPVVWEPAFPTEVTVFEPMGGVALAVVGFRGPVGLSSRAKI